MKALKFIQHLLDHSFVYKNEFYVFIHVGQLTKTLNMHEHTIRDYLNDLLRKNFLLRMNYQDYNHALSYPYTHKLYKLNFNIRHIDDVPEEEIHHSNISHIKKDVDQRNP
jgi:DNA-binding HxlR family transcriptional regulator